MQIFYNITNSAINNSGNFSVIITGVKFLS